MRETVEDTRSGPENARIPVVAIGASAGGLTPLEQFFSHAPEKAGWCYIVIQHLSPDYRSVMDELLGRKTGLKIKHIENGIKIEPDTIFLNRPNTGSVLEGDVFRTFVYGKDDQVPHLPIDSLFASLATRASEKTVAVVLSGSGSDGASGAQLMHAAGGALVVQNPAEADFPSMPRAILSLGIHDRVLDAADIPGAIKDIFETGIRYAPSPLAAEADLHKEIFRVLEKQHNLDFTSYKETNVQRRITRRQHLRGIGDMNDYLTLLREEPEAVNELYQDLLIGVTQFYRDPEAIADLRRTVLDKFAQDFDSEAPVRVWVAGCASGEEAYTIGMEMAEAMRAAGNTRGFRIIATDVHRQSIDRASTGRYTEDQVENVPEHLRTRYFDRRGKHFLIVPNLRQKIIFSVHDTLTDPPFLDLDLVSCRNLLIYLREKAQARVISMFLFGLRKHGALFLGPSETLGHFDEEFEVINARWRLFRKSSGRRHFDREMLPKRLERQFSRQELPERARIGSSSGRMSAALHEFAEVRGREALLRAYDLLLKSHAPSSIIVTSDGEVLAWFGAASAFVDTHNNLTEWSVEQILHRDLHFVINVALEKLRTGETEGFSRRVGVTLSSGQSQPLTLTFETLDSVHRPALLLIRLRLEADELQHSQTEAKDGERITDADGQLLSKRVHELERDLRLTEETLQHVTERLEASGEELQASNEELQASNEELQASNEELQSANEELHAVNEELVTVSAEHERKITELSSLNNETESLFSILGIGVLVVDRRLSVQRFSEEVALRFALEPHDVNRRLGVIGPRLAFIDLPQAAAKAIGTSAVITASGDYEGKPLSIEIHPIADREPMMPPAGAFILFRDIATASERGD